MKNEKELTHSTQGQVSEPKRYVVNFTIGNLDELKNLLNETSQHLSNLQDAMENISAFEPKLTSNLQTSQEESAQASKKTEENRTSKSSLEDLETQLNRLKRDEKTLKIEMGKETFDEMTAQFQSLITHGDLDPFLIRDFLNHQNQIFQLEQKHRGWRL